MVAAANNVVGVFWYSGLFSDAFIFEKEKLVCTLDLSLSKLTFVHLTEVVPPSSKVS